MHDDDTTIGVAENLFDEFDCIDPRSVERDRPRFKARDLEEIHHQPIERLDLLLKEVDCGACLGGKRVAPALNHRDRRRERGEGSPQVMADIRREPRLATGLLLELVDHVVEGIDERFEIGITASGQPDIGRTSGDVPGYRGYLSQRPEDSPAHDRPCSRPHDRGEAGTHHQHSG